MVRTAESGPLRSGILLVVLFGAFIYTSGSGFLNGGLPTAGRAVGLDEVSSGLILSLGALAGVVMAPVWGYLSEHRSRRRLVLAAITMVALAPAAMAIAFGLAPSLPVATILAILLAARLVQAGFGAALLPVTQAYVAQFTEPPRRMRGMGVMSVILSLGTVAGSVLLWVVARAGIMVGFAAIAALGLAALVLAFFLLPEIAPPVVERPHERAVPTAAIWPNVTITLVGYVAYTMTQPLIGLRFIDRFHLDLTAALGQSGLVIAGASLAIIGSQAVVATAGAGWNPRVLLRLGTLVALAGAVLAVLSQNVMGMAAALLVIGLGLGLIVPSNLGMISLATGSGAQAKVGGINTAARGIGIAIGPIAGTTLYHQNQDLPFECAAGLVVIVLLLTLVARNPQLARPDGTMNGSS